MIRKLTPADGLLYVEHLHRVYDQKGWLSSDNEEWVSAGKTKELEDQNPAELLNESWFHVWAKFDQNNNIIQSIRAHHLTHTNRVLIVNYKSELIKAFSPAKDMLPILEQVMLYFENLKVYNFHVVRKVGFFEWRKNKFFEDIPPLDRYNCYFDEVIPADTVSLTSAHQYLANYDVFPFDTGVVCMSLKQEYRRYGASKELSIIPDTREMYNKIQSKKNFCIIGYNPDTQKIGNALVSNLKDHNVTTIGRDNFDFALPNWQDNLTTTLSKIDTPLVVIINLFDYSNITLQQKVFDIVWQKYKNNSDVHIVAIGSTAHYLDSVDYVSQEYFDAKKALNQTCFHIGIKTYFKCKLLLVEPGTVESYLTTKPSWSTVYFTDNEIAKKIIALIDINSRFLSATLNGAHVYIPDTQ